MTPSQDQANDAERIDLLPCPFCGGPATLEQCEGKFRDDVRWSAGCSDAEGDCYGYQSLTTYARRVEAAAAWNRRPSAFPAPAVVSTVTDPMVERVAKAICIANWTDVSGEFAENDTNWRDWLPEARAAYAAMLAAAPTPEPVEAPEGFVSVELFNLGRAVEDEVRSQKDRWIVRAMAAETALAASETAHAETHERLASAILALSKANQALGEAKGRLAASETASIFEGWRERALKAEAALDQDIIS